ncbi:MAG: YceI family protein [Deltaproteobacteria bacterium]|nr:YceI family protein [Deltaproteobacteria bacterium]
MAKWVINSYHTVAEFSVRHMMVTWVLGLFNKITGTLDFDPVNLAASAVEVEIDASSLHTGVAQRDDHLKSPDFFDVAQYPTISFKSTRVEPAGLDHAWVHGELTLRGVTRPVLLDVHWAGPAHLEDDGKIYTSYGFMAKTAINREDFGITYNVEMEHGGVGVSRQVYLTLHAEVDLAEVGGITAGLAARSGS